MTATVQHSYIGPRQVKAVNITAQDINDALLGDLRKIGVNLTPGIIGQMMRAQDANLASQGYGADSLQGLTTTASITTPIQFLQNWLPGYVNIVTGARLIDEFVGIMTAGSWEDEEIVQGVLEHTGSATPYGDYTNVPESSWNANYERRTVVRMEEGLRVGRLEEARAGRVRLDSAGEKRNAAQLALEIERNKIGFYGYNSGNNRTYGFLNDPGLPNYVVVPNGAAGTATWATKTFNEIVLDITSSLKLLRTQSKEIVDPGRAQITLAVATAARDELSRMNTLGTQSVMQWLNATYPNVRVVSAPQLDAAYSATNVMYLYAESVDDGSSDGGKTFIQVVPAKFQVLGVQQLAKAYVEDYSNASAGVMCKRPFAVVRRNGI